METTLQKLKISETMQLQNQLFQRSICITFYGAEDIVFNRRLKH